MCAVYRREASGSLSMLLAPLEVQETERSGGMIESTTERQERRAWVCKRGKKWGYLDFRRGAQKETLRCSPRVKLSGNVKTAEKNRYLYGVSKSKPWKDKQRSRKGRLGRGYKLGKKEDRQEAFSEEGGDRKRNVQDFYIMGAGKGPEVSGKRCVHRGISYRKHQN